MGEASPALLLVDHGSRLPEANELLERIAAELRQRLPGRPVRVAHMELAGPTPEEAVEALVAEGVTAIVVHPYFLAPGRHSTHDIPRRVAEVARRHAGLRVVVSEPLGVHPGLVAAVLDRVREAETR